MRIAVCTPSRGLVHSRTIEAVNEAVARCNKIIESRHFFTHDLPIPDCFNDLYQRANAWGADFIWFVEEDVVPRPDTLSQLMAGIGDVKCADYPIAWNGQMVTQYRDGKPFFTGMGCALIPMWVFRKVGPFRSDISYDIVDGQYIKNENDVGYGGQDVHFFMRCQEEGISLTIMGEVDHLRVLELGKPDTNKGCHDIRPIDKA